MTATRHHNKIYFNLFIMKNLLTRALTGLVYVALIVASVLVSDITMLLLCYLLAVLAVREFVHITGHATLATTVVDILGALVVVSIFTDLPMILTLSLILAYLVIRLVMMVYATRRDALASTAYSFMAMLYIALPLSLLNGMRPILGGQWLVLGMFIMIWLNDTGAYLVGSRIGKHRLLERVSPKKSVEGFIGGVIFAVAAAPLLYYCFPTQFGIFALAELCAMGLCVGIFGTLGDLVESRLKRTVGVKDSGNILPGHGGILDRIDSLLLVTPVLAALILLL